MAKPIPSGVPATRNKSWQSGQKGQGGEGMSKGYGGSAGEGTGPSGPDSDQPKSKDRKNTGADDGNDPDAMASSAGLPSKEHIARVLR
jgi:hypothetical protein